MAADLFVRILFKNNEFDRSINKSKGTVRSFQSDIEKSTGGFNKFISGAGSAAGMISKFAGGLGLAMGTMEIFGKAIDSNSKLQDKYRTAMETGKTVTDQFFSAIYSGDWTIFNAGISEAIDNARSFANEYRKVQKSLVVNKIGFEQKDALKNQLEAIIEDDTKSIEERMKAQSELDRLLIMGVADLREMSDNANTALKSMIKSATGTGRFVNEGNAQGLVLKVYDETSDLRKDLEKYRAARDAANMGQSLFQIKGKGSYWDWSGLQKEYEAYSQEARDRNDELLRLSDSLNDDLFNRFKDLFDEINDLNDKAGTWEKDRAGAKDEILGAKANIEDERKKRAEEESKKPKKGSIDYIETQISNLSNNLKSATDEATRQGIRSAIEKLKDEKLKIEMEALPKGSIDYLNAQISSLTKKLNTETDEAARQGILAAIEKANKEKYNIELEATLGRLKPMEGDKFGVSAKGRNATEDIKSGYISVKGISSDAIKSNYEYADSLGAIGSMMSSVSQLTNEGAASWLSYASNIIQAVGQALPQLSALATKNASVAATGAAASVSSIPVVGWVMAGTAVASVIAAMANVPKFANGGIVPGNLYSGDRVPAMVNSGEMILNRSQQGRLFDILNSKGGVNGKDVRVTGEVVVSGEQMKILLDNTNRKLRRGR